MNNIIKYLDKLNSIKNRYQIPYTKKNMKEEHYVEIMYEELSIEMIKEIERLNNIKKKAINELFDLKDMIYKPETREINFDIQNKISSIIKILGSDKE